MFYREIIRPRRLEIVCEGQGFSSEGVGKLQPRSFRTPHSLRMSHKSLAWSEGEGEAGWEGCGAQRGARK